MLLRRGSSRASRCLRPYGRARLVFAALAAVALSACTNSDPTVTGSIPPSGTPTIAFESVDGPPKPVFDRLVAALSAEAERRELPVVSHTGPAAYRVRAYFATHVEKRKKRAALSWVWDVFDARRNLAFRLSGEEPLGQPGSDVWAQCDEALMLRVATKGFDELVARLGPPPTTPAPAAPQATGPAIAFAGPHR